MFNFIRRLASNLSLSLSATQQIKDLCAILCGLLVAQDFREGQRLIADRDFAHAELAAFFQDALEVGRRYKCMNPDAMRETYGKLLYICVSNRRNCFFL